MGWPWCDLGIRRDVYRQSLCCELLGQLLAPLPRPGRPTPVQTVGDWPRASAIALPTSTLVALPPISGVRGPWASTVSIAPITAAPASACPRWSSIIGAAQFFPIGSAMPLP
jgi:hypothetical protein